MHICMLAQLFAHQVRSRKIKTCILHKKSKDDTSTTATRNFTHELKSQVHEGKVREGISRETQQFQKMPLPLHKSFHTISFSRT